MLAHGITLAQQSRMRDRATSPTSIATQAAPNQEPAPQNVEERKAPEVSAPEEIDKYDPYTIACTD